MKPPMCHTNQWMTLQSLVPTLLGKKGYWKYGIQNEITILITPPLIFVIFYNWLLIKNDMQTTQKLKTWIKIISHNMPELGSGVSLIYAASSQFQPSSGKLGHIYPDFNASMVIVVMVEVVVVLLGGWGWGVRTERLFLIAESVQLFGDRSATDRRLVGDQSATKNCVGIVCNHCNCSAISHQPVGDLSATFRRPP